MKFSQKPLTKDKEAADVDVHLYRSMIGSLMYLNTSRPDIMFVVCACSRFQVTSKTSHLHAVKRIFRYLKGKSKRGLWYPRVSSFDMDAYSDSDYDGANLDRKSITGDYGFNFMNTKIYIDNESTICIIKNPVFHSKTKHIAIRHHFIRDAYKKKLIQMLKIHTDDNVADLLTKSFDVNRFNFLIVNIRNFVLLVQKLILLGLVCAAQRCFTMAMLFRLVKKMQFRLVLGVLNEGEGSGAPIEPQPTPSPTHPSIGYQAPVTESSSSHDTNQDSRDSLEGTSRSKGDQVYKETEELKLTTDDEEIAQDKGSGVKGGSTKELVSTARPEDSTVRLDVGTADPIAPPTTTTSIFNDEYITMAQTLIKMKEEKAKEKGVSIKDIEEFLRPARSILTLKPLPTIDPKDKGKDAKVVRLVYEEELAELEREKEKRQREEEAFKAALAEMYDEVQAGIEADA
nr:hypothetical protein [Tanacetum cinerariifolium]